MTNIKPSECPNYTVIDDPTYGLYIKENFNLWTQVHPGANMLPWVVFDDGFSDSDTLAENFVVEKSDEVFQDFEIRSLPAGWRLPKTPQGPTDLAWWPIPGHSNYLIRADGVKVRNKRYGSRKAKNKSKAKSGYFVLYSGEKQTYWSLSEIGNEAQIQHFLKTGELPDSYLERQTA